MEQKTTKHKEVWQTIFIFLIMVAILSSLFHYAIVNLYPSRIYIGGLMWCPAIATIITLKITKRSISSLNWNLGNWSYIRFSYFIPAFYNCITYLLILLLGFGSIVNGEMILDWANEIGLVGIGTLSTTLIIIIAIVLLGTVEVIRSSATTLGEEIGWRGFFIYELKKVLSFSGTSIFSGIVWATWHWPLIIYYGNNIVLELIVFYISCVFMSFIITYFTFKSKSLWPAVIFHAVSNVYVQKIFSNLIVKTNGAEHWVGENGIMFTIVICVFGIYYWIKGVKEKL